MRNTGNTGDGLARETNLVELAKKCIVFITSSFVTYTNIIFMAENLLIYVDSEKF
jgi:hypothetical protein